MKPHEISLFAKGRLAWQRKFSWDVVAPDKAETLNEFKERKPDH